VPLLRDPDLDADALLDPLYLASLEESAASERAALESLPEPTVALVRSWLARELGIARKRAEAVEDHDLVECINQLERRLMDPGCFLREAKANAKIQEVLLARAGLRLVHSV
jgi:hypothetical protein